MIDIALNLSRSLRSIKETPAFDILYLIETTQLTMVGQI